MRGQLWCFSIFMLVNAFSYYLYNPSPPGFEQPWLYFTSIKANLRIIDDFAKISAGIGYKDYYVFKQDVLHMISESMAYPPGDTDGVNISSAYFDGVPVRIYRPTPDYVSDKETKIKGGMVYVHGGGFVYGSAALYDPVLRRIVKDTGIVLVAIDYRLAPQHPSPAAIEDCIRAARQVFLNAEDLGIDMGRIGIAGDSAGGNLAASLSLSFRDMQGAPKFAYTALIYPWLQALDFNTPSMQQNEPYVIPDLTRQSIAGFALTYINASLEYVPLLMSNRHMRPVSIAHFGHHIRITDLPQSHLENYIAPKIDDVGEDVTLLEMEAAFLDPLNFPLMAETLKGLPPMFVATMGFDTVRDDGFWFVKRLKKDGCNVKHYHDPLGWHDAFSAVDMVDFHVSQRLYDEFLAFIRIFS